MCSYSVIPGESVIGRYASAQPRGPGTPLSRRWWSLPDEEGAEPTVARMLTGTATGLATTVVAFLIPQTLLIAIAFGSADYASGRAGGPTFTLLSALVTGSAGGAGAFVAARELRRAELSQADSLRTAVLPPTVVVTGIALDGLLSGAGWAGFALLLAFAAPSIAVCARSGARSDPRRAHRPFG